MNTILLTFALALPAQCDNCPNGTQPTGRPAPAAVRCPQASPNIRCFRKPCAGCSGGICLSCQQPYFGSAPYNYRVQFDYPWSQQPAYPIGYFAPLPPMPPMPMEEDITPEAEDSPPQASTHSSRKIKATLRR